MAAGFDFRLDVSDIRAPWIGAHSSGAAVARLYGAIDAERW